MLPEGVVRAPMGFYTLRDDVYLSRVFERVNRLDTNENVAEIASFALRIPEGGFVVDAGAFVGDHAITYSQIVGTGGWVWAFEPHPQAFAALALNVGRLGNVVPVNLGLSDDRGKARFSPDPNAGGSFMSVDGPETVRVTTLDHYLLDRIHRCDFVHLDAEGWELRILRGARKLIEKFHPVMLVEVCDKHLRRAGSSEAELTQLIKGMGYAMATIPTHLEPELRDDLCVWGGA